MSRRLALFLALLAPSSALAQPPSLDTLDVSEASPGSRVRITGAHLGAPEGSRLEIDGLPAPTATWTDTQITAYVPRGASGDAPVRIVTPEGIDRRALTITSAPDLGERVAWRLSGDAAGPGQHAPGVLSDGTIVVGDSGGFVYAIAPDGIVRWIVDARRVLGAATAFADRGPIAVDANDIAYVGIAAGTTEHVVALDREGAVVWARNFGTGFVAAGPSIGPDGDVYVLHAAVWVVSTDPPGSSTGMCRLRASDGSIVWSNRGEPTITQVPYEGAPIVFGASAQGGPIDRAFLFTDQRALSTSPGDAQLDSLRAFDLTDGRETFVRLLRRPTGSASPSQVWPTVRDDGRVLQSSFVSSGVGQRVLVLDPGDGEVLAMSSFREAGGLGSPLAGRGGRGFVIRDQSWLDAFEADGSLAWERHIPGGPRANRATIDSAREAIWIPTPGRLVAVSTEDGALLDDVAVPTTSDELTVGCALGLDDARGRAYYVACASTDSWELIAVDRDRMASADPDAGASADGGVASVDGGVAIADASVAPSPAPSCAAGGRSTSAALALLLVAALALVRRRFPSSRQVA